MGPDVRLLRALVALADERHFGRAARRLSLSQPGLSRQIARLERDVGAPLFERTSHGVVPTDVGLRLARRAADALRTLDAAVEAARSGEREAQPVRIGVGETIAGELVARLASALGRTPGLKADVRAGWSAELVGAVCRGALDVVLGHALAAPDALEHEVIALEPLAVHVAAGHPLAREADLSLADLAGSDLIVPPRDLAPGALDHLTACCRAAGFEPRTRIPAVLLPPAMPDAPVNRDAHAFTLLPNSVPPRPGMVSMALREAPRVPLALAYCADPAPADAVTAALDVLRRVATAAAGRTDVRRETRPNG